MWVSLSTTYWSLVVQPPPLTCADCVAPLYQTKKAICLFACRSFSTRYSVCVLSFFLYLSWHALSGSNSSLLLLGGMSFMLELYLTSNNSRETNIIHLSINNCIMCICNKNQQWDVRNLHTRLCYSRTSQAIRMLSPVGQDWQELYFFFHTPLQVWP